jgi:hypothetical protein
MSREDEAWIAEVRRDMGYRHWSADARKAFKLALKWWYQTHNLKIPDDLL